jgi:hypothetical protein
MAVNNLAFSQTIDGWVSKVEGRATTIFREASQRVIETATMGIPVDTGFARASGRASLESMPPIDPSATNKDRAITAFDFGSITAVISAAELGQTIYWGVTAAYALPLEYGHSKQAPAGFVRLAAEQWPTIVADVTAEAKSRAG